MNAEVLCEELRRKIEDYVGSLSRGQVGDAILNEYCEEVKVAATNAKDKDYAEKLIVVLGECYDRLLRSKLPRPILGFRAVPAEEISRVEQAMWESMVAIRDLEIRFRPINTFRIGILLGSITLLDHERALVENILGKEVGNSMSPLRTELLVTRVKGGTKNYLVVGYGNSDGNLCVRVYGKLFEPPFTDFDRKDVEGIMFAQEIREYPPVTASPYLITTHLEEFVFMNVVMNTTYVLSGENVLHLSQTRHVAIGHATDRLGAPYITRLEMYLPVIDRQSTEPKILYGEVQGTVVEVENDLLKALQKVDPLFSTVISKIGKGPILILTGIKTPDVKRVDIAELSLRMREYDRKLVEIEGVVLGELCKVDHGFPTSIVHFDSTGLCIVDEKCAMPILSVKNEQFLKNGRAVLGHYQITLFMYAHIPIIYQDLVYPIVLDMSPVGDRVKKIQEAGFGERVKAELHDYLAVSLQEIVLSRDMKLHDVSLLVPERDSTPMILVKSDRLGSVAHIPSLVADGYIINGEVLKIPFEYLSRYGSRLIVMDE